MTGPCSRGPRDFRGRGASSTSVCLALALLAPNAFAQAVKLNGSLARSSSGDVLDYRIALDGSYVVYRADHAVGMFELFAAPADGSAPTVKLNGPLALDRDVGGSVINVFGAGSGPDYDIASSGRVVFTVDQAVNNVDELHSAPLDGSAAPVRIDGAHPGARVERFWILPDGQHVLYEAGPLAGGTFHRTAIDGSEPVTQLAPGHTVFGVALGPAGGQAVFSTGFDDGYRQQLWVVPTDGSASAALRATSAPPSPFGFTGFADLVVSDDDEHAVYIEIIGEFDDFVEAHLYAVPLDGSHAPALLDQQPLEPYTRPHVFDGENRVAFHQGNDVVSCALDGGQRVTHQPAGWTAQNRGLELTPDRQTLVFVAGSGGMQAIFRAPLEGSQPAVQLASSTSISGFAVSATTLVYATYPNIAQFFAVPLAGGTPVLLDPAPFDTGARDFKLQPDSTELVFRAEPGGTGVTELFAVPLDASALPRRISGDLAAAGDVDHYTLSADGTRAVYLADREMNEAFELSGVELAGGPVVDYNPPFTPGPVLGDVQSFLVVPGEERVLYRADLNEDDAFRLSVARTDGRGDARELTATLDEASSVFTGFAVSPDATRAAFLFESSPESAAGHLFGVTLAGAGAPVMLDNRMGLRAQPLVIDATGTRVVYRRERVLLDPAEELCSAPLPGHPGTKLSLTPPIGDVDEFRLTPDGAAAIYVADHAVPGVLELHRVPLDGSAPAVRIQPALPAFADVSVFALSADGADVAYLADADADQVVELYVVPSDGSGPPVKRSGALVAGGDVTHFALTPDGSAAVYRADQRIDQTFELFGVPLAGGADVVLSPLAASRQVQAGFELSPDSADVVYRADANAAGVVELFRAPVDGSAAPVRLSAPPVAGGGVLSSALAPDGSRVVYRADQRIDGVIELHSVPLAGGAVTLLRMLPATADVDDFRIAPDSGTVLFRADLTADGVLELYGAPLDGSAPAERASLALPSHADVLTDYVVLSGGRAIHRADPEENEVVELYAGFLQRAPRPSVAPGRTVFR